MIVLIVIFTFITTLIICLTLMAFFYRGAGKQTISRLDQYLADREISLSVQGVQGEKSSVVKAVIRHFSQYFEMPPFVRMFDHRLAQAGLPLRSSEFVVIWYGTVIICALLGLIIFRSFWAVIPGALFGYILPKFYLGHKTRQRAKAFNAQLGDALVLIANSLRTGYSFLQAVDLISREMLPPISVEFGRVLKEMNFGGSTEEALHNLAKRIDSDDLELVITAVVIQRQVGGNLAEILDKIAGTIRERIKLKGVISTLTAQGRASGYVIGGLPIIIGLIMFMINPDYMSLLFTRRIGWLLLGMAFVSQMIGVLFIRAIINIET